VPLGDAIYSVQQRSRQTRRIRWSPAARSYSSVTRVFSKRKDLYVFLQAYERTATTMQPLLAFVGFYRAGVKSFETARWR